MTRFGSKAWCRAIEDEIRRRRLLDRTRVIIEQDRAQTLAYTTGWRPPCGNRRTGAPRHG